MKIEVFIYCGYSWILGCIGNDINVFDFLLNFNDFEFLFVGKIWDWKIVKMLIIGDFFDVWKLGFIN